ncbi:MAG: hypothetical protein WDM78_11715 [Puia sp.]
MQAAINPINNERTNATLEQLVLAFEAIAEKHAQINSFYYGYADDITTLQQSYPLLYVDVLSIVPDEWVDNIKFRIAVLDQEMADESNQLTIKSDCRSILRDINIWLRDYYDLEVVWGGTATPCVEKLVKMIGFQVGSMILK